MNRIHNGSLMCIGAGLIFSMIPWILPNDRAPYLAIFIGYPLIIIGIIIGIIHFFTNNE